jgi:hypothetical protein
LENSFVLLQERFDTPLVLLDAPACGDSLAEANDLVVLKRMAVVARCELDRSCCR